MSFIVYQGLGSTIPTLDEGEFGWTTDDKELFIGSAVGGNIRLGGAVNNAVDLDDFPILVGPSWKWLRTNGTDMYWSHLSAVERIRVGTDSWIYFGDNANECGINFLEGAGIDITMGAGGGQDIDVTIATSGGGSGDVTGPGPTVVADNLAAWDGTGGYAIKDSGKALSDVHAESHTIVSHSDTTATGANLTELTNSSETALHSHAGSGGDPDQFLYETFAADGGTPSTASAVDDTMTIAGGTGLTSAVTTDTVTVNLDNTTVTPDDYTNANITVDQQGRITAAANGSAGGVITFNTRDGAVVSAIDDYTWAQINKATSSIADITTKNHSDLTAGDGSDHSFIDQDVTISSEPTLVGTNFTGIPKSAVGLDNVINELQVSSADNTWTADYVDKATPVDADFLIIEDSVTPFAKKRINFSALSAAAHTHDIEDLNNVDDPIISNTFLRGTTATTTAWDYPKAVNSVAVDGGSGNATSNYHYGVINFETDGALTVVKSAWNLIGDTNTITVTMSLDDTDVVAGDYTATNLTVDAQGRITAASSSGGGGGGDVTGPSSSVDAGVVAFDGTTGKIIKDVNTVSIGGGVDEDVGTGIDILEFSAGGVSGEGVPSLLFTHSNSTDVEGEFTLNRKLILSGSEAELVSDKGISINPNADEDGGVSAVSVRWCNDGLGSTPALIFNTTAAGAGTFEFNRPLVTQIIEVVVTDSILEDTVDSGISVDAGTLLFKDGAMYLDYTGANNGALYAYDEGSPTSASISYDKTNNQWNFSHAFNAGGEYMSMSGWDLHINVDGVAQVPAAWFGHSSDPYADSLKYVLASTRFEFSDDLHVVGDLTLTGSLPSHAIVSHDTDATGAELTELTDGSETTLHSHAGGGSGDVVGPDGAIDGNIAAFDTATGKLIKDSGVAYADIAAAFAPANVYKISGVGAYTEYVAASDTNAARGTILDTAIAAASSGDALVVRAGVYDTDDLMKDGITIHFEAGAEVIYTGNGISLFDDEGAARHMVVTGSGVFQNSGSNSANRRVVNLTNGASTLFIEGKDLISDNSVAIRLGGTGAAVVNCYADTVQSKDGTLDNVSSGGTILARAREVTSSNGYVVELDGGTTKVYGARIYSANGNPVEAISGDGIWLQDCLIESTVAQPCINSSLAAGDLTAVSCVFNSSHATDIVGNADLLGCSRSDGDIVVGSNITFVGHEGGDGTDHSAVADKGSADSITGLWNFMASGAGGFVNYDVTVGDVATPDYGMIRIGNSVWGRTNNTTGYNLNGATVIQNVGGPVTGDIEFAIIDSANLMRFGLPKSGVGNATYNPRSMLCAGPAIADSDIVTVGYWQTQGIFDNLACDTSGSGADLGVQNDLEVEGDIFVDSIKESTAAAGVTIDGLLVKDSGIPEAAVTDHVGAIDHNSLSNTHDLTTDIVHDNINGGTATVAHGATGAVVGTTNSQVLSAKTLTTPTIGDFTNATHDHTDAAGGGVLPLPEALMVQIEGTAGEEIQYFVPFSMEITGWSMMLDVSGSMAVDVWHDTWANHPPTVADSIVTPSVTTAAKNSATGLSLSVNQGDVLIFHVDSATTATLATVALTGVREA